MSRVLVINPGSTSTKLALYRDEAEVWAEEIGHGKAELAALGRPMAQEDFRRRAVAGVLAAKGVTPGDLDAVVGRGGLLHPIPGGTYRVNAAMIEDLRSCRYGEHASNLGAILAEDLAAAFGVPAFVVDTVVTDELREVARVTGHPAIRRRSIFHALSQRAAARNAAERLGIAYESGKFLVAHMGGGISIGAHDRGRVVDVVNALDGEGPMSPERSGALPPIPVLDLIESGQTTIERLKRVILTEGGLTAHLGVNDLRLAEARSASGDEAAARVVSAMAYGVAKAVCSLAPALMVEDGGLIDAVVLTGGLARSPSFSAAVGRLLSFLAPVLVAADAGELAAMAAGAERVLAGRETARDYRP